MRVFANGRVAAAFGKQAERTALVLFFGTLLSLALLGYVAVVKNKVIAAKDLLARGLTPHLPGAQAELDFTSAG